MSNATTSHSINSPNNSSSSFTSTIQPAEGNIRRPVVGTSSSSSNSPACAVCKYRRRKCAPDCQLAPFFPADRQRDFLNAHKLYGVSNMLKVLDIVKEPSHKKTAMQTMIFQANVRANDPALGCCRIIGDLEQQILHYNEELSQTFRMLDLCRSQYFHAMQDYTQHQFVGKGKLVMDVDDSYDNYMDGIDMFDSSLKTYNYMGDLGHALEYINVEDGDDERKFKGFQNMSRGKLVQGYMNNQPSTLNDHIKSKKEFTTAAQLFPMEELNSV